MRKITQIQSAIALFIGIALLVPVVSTARTRFTINVGGLDSVAQKNCKPGKYQRIGSVSQGYLEPGSIIDKAWVLTKDDNYCFVVVGDEQATNVDLEVLNRQGSSFSPPVEDRYDDEYAFVMFPARQKTKHLIQVEMSECEAEQCEYALAAYKKSSKSRSR